MFVSLKTELDNHDAIKLFKKQSNRCVRIARGAGVSIHDVNQLIAQYSKISKTMVKAGGISGMLNNRGNTAATMSGLEKLIDPRVLNQMGKFKK